MTRPWNSLPPPLSGALVDSELKTIVSKGTIELVSFPQRFVSNIFLVCKKSGGIPSCHQPARSVCIHYLLPFQNGRDSSPSGPTPREQLVYPVEPQGCLSHGPHPFPTPSLPLVPLAVPALAAHLPPLWSQFCALVLH